MDDDLNSVKTGQSRDSYHHGALRPALLEAAEAVIAERGLDGFSLRETARRAGVSPAAPAHHFGDSKGLLTAIATSAFVELGDAMERVGAAMPEGVEKVRALGFAYVDFALAHPARYDVMWRKGLLRQDDPDLIVAGDRAYALLADAVRGVVGARGEAAEESGSLACWSMVHGLARLALDGALGADIGAASAMARDMLPRILDHLELCPPAA